MNELSEKDAKREDRRMQQAVERLSDEQLAALAAWYARQPLPAVETDPEDQVSEATLRLVFVGHKTRLIRPRASCHGSHGQGAVIDVPAIARQNVKYFVDTMRDYARDKRTYDVYSRMRITAKALTRDEIDELAVYYARLGGQKKENRPHPGTVRRIVVRQQSVPWRGNPVTTGHPAHGMIFHL